MKKSISNLSEQTNSVANIAKELLNNDGVIFNAIWSNNGYLSIIEYFKKGINSGISKEWFAKLSAALKSKCGKYNKDNYYAKTNAMIYLSNLMLAGDGMGIENNAII